MASIEILPPETGLPTRYARRLDRQAEQIGYVARPGLRALPSGSLTMVAFAGLQVWTLTILLWAIWWPAPRSRGDWTFSLICTTVLAALVMGVIGLLLRKFPGFLLAVLRSPFIRLTVTDRRMLWTLPWGRAPLMEIGRERIMGGILGPVDRKGAGSAAVMLVPGDPSADIDGNIHFDRLPDAAAFVAAVRGC
ncbi:hypothetical protein [Sphingomonas nostoxanthinifaciens]|uniref:hypothetical protein n=1 Tax=Sphingomonas nostoxanthinifaciens TaxID=2872652 RepID=UPI001CC2075F|nr:hypothetical protein [Sphingomonas nostoxanthinifaciens]UAK24726.1 hypothetical protein K8P63_00420 [Sphingomonas nostoxanthinifaciens]